MTMDHQTTSNFTKNLPTAYLPSDWTSDEINEKAYHFGAKVFHP